LLNRFKQVKKVYKKIVIFRKIPLSLRIGTFLILTILFLPYLTGRSIRKHTPSSQAVYDCNGKLLRLSISDDEKYRLWIPLDEMPSDLVKATLLKEDRYFWIHPGVNPFSLVKAFWNTYISKSKKMGGSTLTMQLVRIRHKLKTRTIYGKMYQVYKAFQYELLYTKKDILEAYLNLVPYGGNIEGVGAASLIYFEKEAKQLILPEVLALTVIPQNPSIIDTEALESSRLRLLDMWAKAYPKDAEKKELYAMPFEMRKQYNLPFLAPHFVETVLRDNPEKVNIRTTLNLKLQYLLEKQIKNYIREKSEIGIKNASALLVDVRDMSILVSIGSADYFNNEIQGQVNGTRARRSPGSSIKPFIYALAMDQGIVHPKTMLKDSPFGIGGFNPENFDGEFHGPLSVHDALIQSRNVPAVQVAMLLKNPDLYDFLKEADIYVPQEREYYGMSIGLGGTEVTMEDLTRLYAMLANEGILHSLNYLLNSKEEKGERILSRESSFIILDILKDNPRPDQYYNSEWVKDHLSVHWKTGTSYAYKDAWAVGLFGPYVLAVWIGNFNGIGNPSFVGARAAGPLFFQMIDAIKSENPDLEQMPIYEYPNIDKVKVCSVSGQIPNLFCPNTVFTWFIPGCSPIKKCEIHRAVPIDVKTGLRVAEEGNPGTKMEVFEFWPSDILKIFQMAGIPRRIPPGFHPSCLQNEKGYNGLPPNITSPQKGLIYHYRTNFHRKESISLTAVSDADVRELCWFANKQYLGKVVRNDMLLWNPKPGQYVVRVVDDQGRSDSIDVTVYAVN